MKYELAKKLDEVGFPELDKPEFDERGMGFRMSDPKCPGRYSKKGCKGCRAYVPTLSELIEACGDGFEALIKPEYDLKIWTAGKRDDSNDYCCVDSDYPKGEGSTPEEAVANLYLALKGNSERK